jgi:hypothetical protein
MGVTLGLLLSLFVLASVLHAMVLIDYYDNVGEVRELKFFSPLLTLLTFFL